MWPWKAYRVDDQYKQKRYRNNARKMLKETIATVENILRIVDIPIA